MSTLPDQTPPINQSVAGRRLAGLFGQLLDELAALEDRVTFLEADNHHLRDELRELRERTPEGGA